MEIKSGRYYKTRDGRKEGPMSYDDRAGLYVWDSESSSLSWTSKGKYWSDMSSSPNDLVSEWVEETVAVDEEKGNQMKFDYTKTKRKDDVIARLFLFDGGPSLCLCVKTKDDKWVWFYEDGDIFVEDSDVAVDEDLVQNFYRGDSITITF